MAAHDADDSAIRRRTAFEVVIERTYRRSSISKAKRTESARDDGAYLGIIWLLPQGFRASFDIAPCPACEIRRKDQLVAALPSKIPDALSLDLAIPPRGYAGASFP